MIKPVGNSHKTNKNNKFQKLQLIHYQQFFLNLIKIGQAYKTQILKRIT